MPYELNQYAWGDLDYIAKLNSDMALIQSVLNSLVASAQSGGAIGTTGAFFLAIFNGNTAIIGTDSYVPTPSGSELDFTAGAVYRASSSTVVMSIIPTSVDFTGQPADTYYISIGANGEPEYSQDPGADDIYSVLWTGGGFTTLTKIAPTWTDTAEMEAARSSAALATDYTTLDDRLEAIEEALPSAGSLRAISCTVSLSAGNIAQGRVQVPFSGTIVGWSAIGQASGGLTVEIDRGRGAAVPPISPVVPNTTTDKISASAPVTMSAEESNAVGAAGVTTWDTDVLQWDVFQFNVTAMTTMTWATIQLWVQES